MRPEARELPSAPIPSGPITAGPMPITAGPMLSPVEVRRTGPAAPGSAPPRGADTRTLAPLVAWALAGLIVGGALVLAAYSLSRRHGGYGYTYVFFAGVGVCFVAPLWWQLRRVRTSPTAALVAIGVASYLPHFLRAPTRVYYSDEFAHYRQAAGIARTGRLFQVNPLVPEARNYPGFELLVTQIRHLTGLSLYRSGTILILLAHVAVILGVHDIARHVVGRRGAVVAAVVYALSPQVVLFDSLFSYETLGLVFFVWGLAFACRSLRADRGRIGQRADVVGTAACVAASVVTHHVSSIALVAGIAVLAASGAILGRTGRPRTGETPAPHRGPVGSLALIAVAGAGLVAGWATYRHAGLGTYLGTDVVNGLKTVYVRLGGSVAHSTTAGGGSVTASRGLLSAASKPEYELLVAEATPVVALAAAVTAVVLRRGRTWTPQWVLCCALTLAYFALLPLLIAANGQTAVHRSWAFSYVGLAVVGTAGAEAVAVRFVARRSLRRSQWGGVGVLAGCWSVAVLLAVSAFGTGVSTVAAFPGPFQMESNGRGVPAELFGLADWFARSTPPGATVYADTDTADAISGLDGDRPDPALASQLFLAVARPDPGLVAEVRARGGFVVFDRRLLTDRSATGNYFSSADPPVFEPLFPLYLQHLLAYRWLEVVHRTTHYIVMAVRR